MAHEFERQLFDLVRDFKRFDAEAARPVPPPQVTPSPEPTVAPPADPRPSRVMGASDESLRPGAAGIDETTEDGSESETASNTLVDATTAAANMAEWLWGVIWKTAVAVVAGAVAVWALVGVVSNTRAATGYEASTDDTFEAAVARPDSMPVDTLAQQYSWPFETSDVGSPAVPQCQRDLRSQRGTVMVEGLFVENECLGADFGRYRAVLISGQRGDSLIATVRSTEFDPYVTLAAPDGTEMASDDDSDGGLNARLIAVLPDSSDYWLVVSQYAGISRPPASGRFELVIRWLADTSVAVPTESGAYPVPGALGTTDGSQVGQPASPGSTDAMPQVLSMPTRRVIAEALAVFDVTMINKDWAPILRGQPRQLDAVRELLADPLALLCSDCGVQSQVVGSPGLDAQRRQVVPGMLVIRIKSGGGILARRVPVRFVGQPTAGGGWLLTEIELTGMPF